MMRKPIVALALAGFFLAGCQSMQDNPKQTMGTLAGAGLGALAGSQVGGGKGQMVGIAIGTLAGAFLGSEIGKSLDNADKAIMQKTSSQALESTPSGVASAWRNPDSGNSGTITPTRTYQTAQGEDCREFENSVTVDGRTEKAMGRACRQADGTWRIVQ
ncbi:MAG: RT0821/Lpp0805 family surface protein [Magnetospirillum sp. WYHS-4]